VKHRVITDPISCITLTLGVDDGEIARISWSEGSCHVIAEDLSQGRWVLLVDLPGQTPPAAVVCRATALAVGAWIKEGVQHALDKIKKEL